MVKQKKVGTDTKSNEINIDQPIVDAQQDKFDRALYAKTIAQKIIDTEEGFNFGISGEWGSGKTSMLNLIQPYLEKANVKVIRFSPWKYAEDKLSLRRTFLFNMAKELKVELPRNLYETIKIREEKSLKNKLTIVVKVGFYFGIYLLAISTILLISLGIISYFVQGLDILNTYASLFFIPAVVALLPTFKSYLEMITIERTDPEVLYVEQFDSLFNKILEEGSKDGDTNKLVFFIDDLDRCTGKEIIRVLSGLMTFFENNKNIYFVITANHKVIEKTLEKTLEKSDAAEYLKKIFQINWILPPIPPNVIREYIEKGLSNKLTDTGEPYVRNYLIDMIQRNFEANPRQITYFIRDLVFQIDALESKIRRLESKHDEENEELKNLLEVRKHPDLLAKVLILRNKYSEDYKRISENPQLMVQVEKDETSVEKATSLIKSQPHFSRKGIDPQYFVFLSGQTGFEERIKADPFKVVDYAKTADIENLKDVIQGSVDHKRSERLDAIIEAIPGAKEIGEKVNLTKSLLSAVNFIEEKAPQKEKIHKLLDLLHDNQEICQNLQSEHYREIFKVLSDDTKSISYAKRLFNENPYIQPDYRNKIFQGFVDTKTKIAPEILSLFYERLMVLMDQDENEQDQALDFLIKFSVELKKFKNRKDFVDKILEIFSQRDIQKKQKPLDAIAEIGGCFNLSQKRKFASSLEEIVSTQGLQEIIFIIKNLDKIGRIVNIKGLMEQIVGVYHTKPVREKQQILDHLKVHHSSIKDKQKGRIIDGLLDSIDKEDGEEKKIALNLIQGHPEFIPHHVLSRRRIFTKFMELIKSKQADSYQQTIEIFWNLKSMWEKDVKISKTFNKILKELSKEEDQNIANLAKDTLNKWQIK